MVGRDSHRERVNELPTKWVTNSSEAFSLLCIENYYEHIMDLAKNKSSIRPPSWTAGARGAMRNQGWNKTGIGRFKELCRLVSEDREKNKDVDVRYMEKEIDQMQAIQNKKRKHESVITARECGWDTAYEDDMSIEGNKDLQSESDELNVPDQEEIV